MMVKWITLAAMVLGCAAVVGCQQGGRVVTEETVFRKFPGAMKASDGVLEVVVIPEGGRVISVGFVGEGRNELWVNPDLNAPGAISKDASKWNNYGGDKTWAWAQSDWKVLFGNEWPPAAEFDQGAFKLTRTKDGIRMEGPVGVGGGGEGQKLKVVREVKLMGGGVEADGRRVGRVRVSSRIEAVGVGEKTPVAVWHVTQLPWPEAVRVEGVKGGEGAGWEKMNDKTAWPGAREEGDVLVLPGDAGGGAKVGADGKRLVWVGTDGRELRQRVVGANAGDLRPREQLQVYRGEKTGKEGDYVELEVTGPRVEVRPGRAAELVVEWEVVGARGGR